MYPEAAHKPALELADRLLQGPGSGWAQRVFYSDDGSTAVEIGLKMALRSYCAKKVRAARRPSQPAALTVCTSVRRACCLTRRPFVFWH